MNILFITPQLPYPPHQGTTLRNFNIIRQLVEQAEQSATEKIALDVLTFRASSDAPFVLGPLEKLCRRIDGVVEPMRSSARRAIDTFRSPLPDMALRLESADMRALVRQWVTDKLGNYDVVQIEGIEVAQYGLLAQEISQTLRGRPLPLVFDNHNCEYLLQKRNALTDLRIPKRWPAALYSLIQWQKLVRYEAMICRRAAATAVVSAADGAALRRIVPELRPIVVSNGIAVNEYRAVPQENLSDKPPRLIFIGKMDYRPNIDAVLWFAHSVLPLIQAHQPNVQFDIVGANPHTRLDELRINPAINITGRVDELHPFLQRAAVYVIPLRVGGGTRFKALEAMAAGKPTVSTRLGVEGIPVEDGRELLLADEPISFAEAVLRLLADAESDGSLSQTLSSNARQFVVAHYDWAQIVPRFAEIYRTVTAE